MWQEFDRKFDDWRCNGNGAGANSGTVSRNRFNHRILLNFSSGLRRKMGGQNGIRPAFYTGLFAKVQMSL
jgi:hypothetical protein